MIASLSQQDFDLHKFIDRWVSMWNTYDLAQVDNLFLPSPELTYFSSERETVMKGIEAVREHHRKFGFVDGGKKAESKLWVEDLHAMNLGTAAVVTGIWFFSKSAWKTQRGPFTFVYTQKDNEFLLAHVHFGNYA